MVVQYRCLKLLYLETVQMDKNIYYAYFKGKDWDKLDKEQFVFKGDTVFYCVY